MGTARVSTWAPLFTISINDLNVGSKCNTCKFANVTKLNGKVSFEGDAKRLQGDLDRLSAWAGTWYNVRLSTLAGRMEMQNIS